MANWNRNDQNAYTGISAQRRNRHKTGVDPVAPDSPYRRPVMPERPQSAAGRDYRSAEEKTLKTGISPESVIYSRPELFADPETPDKPAAPAEPETEAEPELSGEPELSAETTPAEEPESLMAPEADRELSVAGESAEADEPEDPEKPEETKKPEEPGDATRAIPAADTAAQGADSRVPLEARRMAAAPYGSAASAGRQSAAAQATRKQPVRPRYESTSDRPRPDGRMSADRTARPAGRAPVNGQRSRVNVGYAPGRMSEDMTRQIPTGEAVRESLYTRDAREYLEKRKQPFRTQDGGNETPPDRPGNKALRIIVALLVVAGLVLTGVLILKHRNSPEGLASGGIPQILEFSHSTAEGQGAPTDVIFSVRTDKSASGMRLRGENDTDLDTVVQVGVNADVKLWSIKLHVETSFVGTVVLQVQRNGSEEWIDTAYTTEVNITSPLDVEPAAVTAAEPDGADEGIPEEEDTEEDMTDPEDLPDETGEEPEEEDAESLQEDEDPEAEDETRENAEEPAEDIQGNARAGDDELPSGELRTPAPTNTRAPEEPTPTAAPPLTAEADPKADPALITSTTVYTSVTKKEKAYSRPAKELIHMPEADLYTKQQLGVLTFRGDNFRRNAAAGALSDRAADLKVRWKEPAGSARGTSQTFYGYGWTGQPVIARWSKEVRSLSNLKEEKKSKTALKEVIIAGVDGVIRFLDLDDGAATRNIVKLGYPMRGTPSLHPRGYPFMSVGQFARKMRGKTGKIGLRQYNLFTSKEMKMIDGLDGKYHRPLNNVGSFETSALVDRESDTLIAIGTNGALYLESLGTTFDYNQGIMTISPSVTVMTSKAKGQKNTALMAVESSPSVYDKYVFYADMGGVLRCVDTNTLKPVWAVETGDSVMAAVALDMTGDRTQTQEERELNLYTANMLNNRKKGDSNIQIRRYDALSGREIWCTDIGVYKGKKDKEDVGAKASPVIGQNSLDKLVYFTVTGLSTDGAEKLGLNSEDKAALIALEKETGRIVWSFGLSSRSESSPLALYDEAGNGWIIQCEQNGYVHMLDGLTGSEISKLNLEAEIEASPAVYNNVVVIGTTGKNTAFVYGIEVLLDHSQEGGFDNEEVPGGA